MQTFSILLLLSGILSTQAPAKDPQRQEGQIHINYSNPNSGIPDQEELVGRLVEDASAADSVVIEFDVRVPEKKGVFGIGYRPAGTVTKTVAIEGERARAVFSLL